MKPCSNCQYENREGAKFCNNCGKPLPIPCSACGAANRVAARFCDNCGAALGGSIAPQGGAEEDRVSTKHSAPGIPSPTQIAPVPTADERRIVTILFCDVKGSTEAAERLDPEEWAEIINGAFECMIRPVYKYEGLVARLMGDAILAFFGAPVAHEDDPQRAILAGLEIFTEIAPYKAQVFERWGVDFDLRVGINTGLVMVGLVGSDLQMEYTALGDAINLASRMEQTALPGTVQVAEDTYQVAAPLFDWLDLGETTIKGKEHPVRTYRPLRPKAQPGRLRGLESYEIYSPMVGRDVEFAFLQQRFQRLLEGQGAFALIIGEAGLGKSRLVAELQRVAGELPPGKLLSASGSTLSYHQTSSYYPWREALRALIGSRAADLGVTGEFASDEPEALRSSLSAVCQSCAVPEGDLPFLETLLGIEGESGRQVLRGFQGDALVRRMIDAARGFLRSLAGVAPVLLVLDDLHWADPASLDLLLNVADLPRQHRLLIIGVMRPDRQAESWEFRRKVQDKLGADYGEISLQPLPVETSKKLLNNLLNEDHLPGGLRSQILSKVEGNPFYLEEVVRSLIQTGALVRSDGQSGSQSAWNSASESEAIEIPENLQTLLVARIDRLEKEARQTLQLASVIGRSFYYRILAAVYQIAATKAGLEGDLNALEQAELIMQANALPEPSYIFRHALTQEAAYRTILLKQRRQFHRQVGEAIESLFAGRLEEFYPVLAHHFAEARDGRALRYTTLAGDAAFRLYAIPEAIKLYQGALALAKSSIAQHPVASTNDGAEQDLVRLYLRLGRCYELKNSYPEALELYAEMGAHGRADQDRRLEMEALIAQALVYALPLATQNKELCFALADQAAVLAEALADGPSQAKILWIKLVSNNYTGNMDLGLPFGEQSVAIARSLGLQELLASALQDLSYSYMAGGRLDQALLVLDESRSLWQALDNQPMLAENSTNQSMVSLFRGDFAGAIELSNQAYGISERIQNNWGVVNSRVFISAAYWAQGEIDRAIETLEWVIPEGERCGHPGALMARIQLAILYDSIGSLALALEAIRQALELYQKFPPFLVFAKSISGWLHLHSGDLEMARQMLDESLSTEAGQSILEVDIRTSFFELEYYVVQAANGAPGMLDQAAALAQEIETLLLSSTAHVFLPDLSLLAARVADLQGNSEAALAWLERGAAAAHAIDNRITGHALEIELARRLEKAGSQAAAKQHRATAWELADFILAHTSDPELRASFQDLCK